MSVLIKGMEMPTDNTVLLRIYPQNDGVFYVEQLDIDDDILDKYWAVPVPPHGRLIDADAFSEKILEIVARQRYDEFYTESLSIGAILREVVNELRGVGLDGFNNAPTIIEAEGEEHGRN